MMSEYQFKKGDHAIVINGSCKGECIEVVSVTGHSVRGMLVGGLNPGASCVFLDGMLRLQVAAPADDREPTEQAVPGDTSSNCPNCAAPTGYQHLFGCPNGPSMFINWRAVFEEASQNYAATEQALQGAVAEKGVAYVAAYDGPGNATTALGALLEAGRALRLFRKPKAEEVPAKTATREFVNEFGNDIAIFVMAGRAGKNISSRVAMRGPRSEFESNMTRMELEQLYAAIAEICSPARPLSTEQEPMDGAHMSYLAERWATYHDDGGIRYEFESASDLAEFVRTFKPLPAEIEVSEPDDEDWDVPGEDIVELLKCAARAISKAIAKFSTPKAETPRLTDDQIFAAGNSPAVTKGLPHGAVFYREAGLAFGREIERIVRGETPRG